MFAECSVSLCTGPWYMAKYKATRAALWAMGQINRRKMKEIYKVRQRVFQVCQDGLVLTMAPHDQDIAAHFKKIKELLGDECLIP